MHALPSSNDSHVAACAALVLRVHLWRQRCVKRTHAAIDEDVVRRQQQQESRRRRCERKVNEGREGEGKVGT
eukprot:3611735-Pleurochrysis_carterae.AAC.1